MLIFGNLCLCLAALVYLVPWQLVLNEVPRGPDAGMGMFWGTLIIALPLGLLLTFGWAAVVARDGLQWLTQARALQYLAVLGGGLAVTVVIALAAAMRTEPLAQIPWAIRPLVPHAAWVLPPLLIAGGIFLLNAAGSTALVSASRIGWVAAVGTALLVCCGLLVQLLQSQAARADARVQAETAFQQKRDNQIYAEIEQMTPERDLARLLNHSNVWEAPPIRELALRKLASHPDLSAGIEHELLEGAAYEAIIYLQGNDPPEPARLAAPVAVAIERIAVELADEIAGTHTLYAEQGEPQVMRILEVVARFQRHGVDYRPALVKLRQALDDPRPNQVRLLARARLDRWLAGH